MTSAYTDLDPTFVPSDVYVPQEDSQLLIDVMEKTGLARGSRVADLCTGTGIAGYRGMRAGRLAGHRVRHLPACGALCTDRRRGCRRRCFGASRLVGAGGRVRPVRPGGLQSALRAP